MWLKVYFGDINYYNYVELKNYTENKSVDNYIDEYYGLDNCNHFTGELVDKPDNEWLNNRITQLEFELMNINQKISGYKQLLGE
jgi:hypothetical protein